MITKEMIKIITKAIIVLYLAVIMAGCNGPQKTAGQEETVSPKTIFYEVFGPAKIEILPLSNFTDSEKGFKISVYVSLLDSFGCSQKWPVVFRFELYEYLSRSVEPLGKRIKIWPDIDLKEPAKNNQYWQDFLRAYKFNLDIESADRQNYILQSTVILPDEKRLTSQIFLKLAFQKSDSQ